MLAMRMQTEGLDTEERMYPGTTGMDVAMTRTSPEMTAAIQSTPTTPTTPTPTTPPPTDAPSQEDEMGDMRKKPNIAAILAPVIEQWECEETKTSTTEPEQSPTPPRSDVETTSLGADVLDGVDDQLREALRAAGYATLTALAEVEPLELSRATGRTYSEACRVRFLAKRAMECGNATEEPDMPMTEEPGMPMTEAISTPMTEEPGMPMTEATSTPMTETPSTFEVTESPETPNWETPEESTTTDCNARAEAERILAELTGNADPATDRLSAAPPERQYPQDPPEETCDEEEGPGGPFA